MSDENLSAKPTIDSSRKWLKKSRIYAASGMFFNVTSADLEKSSESYREQYQHELQKSEASHWPQRLTEQERRLRKPDEQLVKQPKNLFEEVYRMKAGKLGFLAMGIGVMATYAPKEEYPALIKVAAIPLMYVLTRTTLGIAGDLTQIRKKREEKLTKDTETIYVEKNLTIEDEIAAENNLFLEIGKKNRRERRLRIVGSVAITSALISPSFSSESTESSNHVPNVQYYNPEDFSL